MERETLPYRPCVGIVLVNNQGMIFAGERLDTPDAWQMPQGGVDDGESGKEAALRELEEEIGVSPDLVQITAHLEQPVLYDLPDELVGKLWGGKFRGQSQTWFKMTFKGHDSDINLHTKEPEFRRWRWMHDEDIIKAIVPFKKHVYEQVFDGLLNG